MARKKSTLLLTLLIFLGSSAFFCAPAKAKPITAGPSRTAWLKLQKILSWRTQKFQGQAAILVRDLKRGWEIDINADKSFASASLVKIPIMAACFYAAREGKVNLKDKLTLKASAKTAGSGVLKNTRAGRSFSVEELIGIMVTHSDNTASNMLIDLLGLDYLNRGFKKMGLTQTNLARRMMDFKARKKGVENYTSAKDIALLLDKIYRKKLISKEASEKCLALLLRQKVNDRIPVELPDDTPVAHKTGLERRICHDVGIVFTPQGDFLLCVLTKSKAPRPQVKKFISKVALYVYNSYQ